jgi:hypothetical protein
MNRSASPKASSDLVEEYAFWIILIALPAAGALFSHLAKWSPGEQIALVAVLLGGALAAMSLYYWHRVRLAQAEATLKQTMLQRGLDPDEIERLLSGPSGTPEVPVPDTSAIEEVTACLKGSGVSAATMEQVFMAMRSTEPARWHELLSAIRALAAHNDADDEEVLAVVHGLCGSGNPSAAQAHSPSADRRAIEEIVAIQAEPSTPAGRSRD